MLCYNCKIEIDTSMLVIVALGMTYAFDHSRVKIEGCGEIQKSLVSTQWPQSWYSETCL